MSPEQAAMEVPAMERCSRCAQAVPERSLTYTLAHQRGLCVDCTTVLEQGSRCRICTVPRYRCCC
jgi:hypothetical protein